MSFYEVMDAIDSFLWGTPFLAFVILVGLYFTIRSGMFTITHFGHVMKHTLGSMASKEANAKDDKHISPFEAVCVAIGGCVGNATSPAWPPPWPPAVPAPSCGCGSGPSSA